MSVVYGTAVGNPPHPATSAWLRWYFLLLKYRLDEVPLARDTTYYFSQAGDDGTGDGSEGTPWKTIAKAQTTHDGWSQVAGGLRLRFKRGEVWNEAAGLALTKSYITVDDYGTTDHGDKPLLANFASTIASGGANWTQVAGDHYKAIGQTQPGWIRDEADRLDAYSYQNSAANVAANAVSWWWEAADGGTIHINAGSGVDPNNNDYEYNSATACDGIAFTGDNIRIENLRVDGFGCTASEQDAADYAIRAGQAATESSVIVGCESYYSGNHSIIFFGVGGVGGFCTVVDCVAGYSLGAVFTGYNGSGDHEVIFHNCVQTFGSLPRHDGVLSGLSEGSILNVHASAAPNKPALAVAFDCTTTHMTDRGYPNATWGKGDCQLQATHGYGSRTDWAAIRQWCVNYTMDVPELAHATYNSPRHGDFLMMNAVYRYRIDDTAPNALNLCDCFGYVNCLWDFRDDVSKTRQIMKSITCKFINCHFAIQGRYGATLTWGTPGFTATSLFANTIFACERANGYLTNMNVTANDIKNNAYFRQRASDYANDAGKVTLAFFPPPGGAPSAESPLYQAGGLVAGDIGSELEYDINWTPRFGTPSIGPVTHPERSWQVN